MRKTLRKTVKEESKQDCAESRRTNHRIFGSKQRSIVFARSRPSRQVTSFLGNTNSDSISSSTHLHVEPPVGELSMLSSSSLSTSILTPTTIQCDKNNENAKKILQQFLQYKNSTEAITQLTTG
jgi:hypothetical protein